MTGRGHRKEVHEASTWRCTLGDVGANCVGDHHVVTLKLTRWLVLLALLASLALLALRPCEVFGRDLDGSHERTVWLRGLRR